MNIKEILKDQDRRKRQIRVNLKMRDPENAADHLMEHLTLGSGIFSRIKPENPEDVRASLSGSRKRGFKSRWTIPLESALTLRLMCALKGNLSSDYKCSQGLRLVMAGDSSSGYTFYVRVDSETLANSEYLIRKLNGMPGNTKLPVGIRQDCHLQVEASVSGNNLSAVVEKPKSSIFYLARTVLLWQVEWYKKTKKNSGTIKALMSCALMPAIRYVGIKIKGGL